MIKLLFVANSWWSDHNTSSWCPGFSPCLLCRQHQLWLRITHSSISRHLNTLSLTSPLPLASPPFLSPHYRHCSLHRCCLERFLPYTLTATSPLSTSLTDVVWHISTRPCLPLISTPLPLSPFPLATPFLFHLILSLHLLFLHPSFFHFILPSYIHQMIKLSIFLLFSLILPTLLFPFCFVDDG